MEDNRPLINGGVMAACFVFSLFGTKGLPPFFLSVGVFFIWNFFRRPVRDRWFWSFSRRAGFGLLILNAGIFGAQTGLEFGPVPGLKEFVFQMTFIAMFFSLFLIHGRQYIKPVLLTMASFFLWFGILNVLAGQLGISNDELMDRTTAFESRYTGGFRFQTALYSAWQVSGMLRWAVPLAFAYLYFTRFGNKIASVFLLVLAVVCGVIMMLIEYRAAVFPLLGLIVWVAVFNSRLRAIVACAFIAYMVAAPVMFGIFGFDKTLEEILPDQLLHAAGNQNASDVSTLSGRSTMWSDGWEELESGKHFLIGEGHLEFNASPFLTYSAAYSTESAEAIQKRQELAAILFTRLSFHQAFLDILFIYGVVPGLAIVFMFFFTILRGWLLVLTGRANAARGSDLQFALLALGLVGLSNCHDGFFVVHNLFYMICVAACISISDSVKARAFAEKTAKKSVWAAPAVPDSELTLSNP